MMTSLLKMAASAGRALIPFFLIYVAATFSYALLNFLGLSRRLRPIFILVTFVVVGMGAYAASFVTDMISEALFGQLPLAHVVWPCITWSLIAVCSLAICARRAVPFLVRAVPFWLFGGMALVASRAHSWNLMAAIPLILGGVVYGLFAGERGSAKAGDSMGGDEYASETHGRWPSGGDSMEDSQAANLAAARAALTGRPFSEIAAAARGNKPVVPHLHSEPEKPAKTISSEAP